MRARNTFFDDNYFIRNLGFRIILFFYFFTWIVPFFKSLPLTPHENFYIYYWFLFCLIACPQIFVSREFMPAFYVLILHIIYLLIGNYEGFNPKHSTLIGVFMMYAFPISVFVYMFKLGPLDGVRIFAPLILVFLVITSLTTIVALHRSPDASRLLAGNDDQEQVLRLLGLNVGTYDFVYQLALVGPLMLYFFRKRGEIVWLLLFVLFSVVIFYAQFAAALILFLINAAFTLFILAGVSVKRYLILVGVFVVSIFLLKPFFIDMLIPFSSAVKDLAGVHEKINEVILALKGRDLSGTNLESYAVRYEQSLNAFLKSPIIGGNSGGGHHYWMDVLALYGLAGFLFFVSVFLRFVKNIFTMPFFTECERTLLLNCTLMFIAIGVNKNIIFAMPVVLFVIFPMLLLRYGAFFLERQSYRKLRFFRKVVAENQ